MWVKCNSHRARHSLARLFGDLGLGAGWCRWPSGEWPSGEYFEVPEEYREAVARIKGLTILARKPKDLMRRMRFSQPEESR